MAQKEVCLPSHCLVGQEGCGVSESDKTWEFPCVCVCVCVCARAHAHAACSVMSDSLQPIDCSLPGSSVHGISQARILEWVAILTQGLNLPLLLGRRILYYVYYLWSVALWVTFLHSSPSTPRVTTFFMWNVLPLAVQKPWKGISEGLEQAL